MGFTQIVMQLDAFSKSQQTVELGTAKSLYIWWDRILIYIVHCNHKRAHLYAYLVTQEFFHLPKVWETLAQFETSGVKVIFDNFCITSMARPWSSRCIWCTASCVLVKVEKSQVVGPWETFQTSMLNMLWSKVWRENMTENRFQEFQGFPIWWNTWFDQVVYITSLIYLFTHLPNYCCVFNLTGRPNAVTSKQNRNL